MGGSIKSPTPKSGPVDPELSAGCGDPDSSLGRRRQAVDISVIFPLLYLRGPTPLCVESWTRKQSLDPQRFEVIVVSPGVDREIERLVGEYLRPHDRFEVLDSRELYALYDHGIRIASAPIAMITEAHVQAGRRVLERLVGVFAETGCRAATCRAVSPKQEGYLATMEGRLFEEEVAGWGADGHRRRLLERGFAIQRRAYLEYGGFPHEYGLFAGRIFGSRLDSSDESVPYVREAAVVHYNSTNLDDIYEGVRSFTHGELQYRRDADARHVRSYFGPAPS